MKSYLLLTTALVTLMACNKQDPAPPADPVMTELNRRRHWHFSAITPFNSVKRTGSALAR